ncbi:N-acetylneuraminate synthase family protein [Desulfonatronum sp. SC1]|uniref:N-acetylneuraminate synthase family protein n=1 Tax=Desulfonatronum sp. SC1 TaxID=2109626 RepID=UPI0018EE836F|nr:N-acetylneuraminate synthase family protein [Desulfonatronum sp. SC1]
MNNTVFIAEVSSNHHRDLDRCLRFIDTAGDIGCDGVKFQLFKIDKLFAPEILARSEMHRKRKDWKVPLEYLSHLAKRCHERNMAFSRTEPVNYC